MGWLATTSLLIGLAGAPAPAPAPASVAATPPQQGAVTDTAGVLTAANRASLNRLLSGYASETRHQIAVLIVPSLHGESIADLSLRVANAWRVGLPGWNDGVLVTFAVEEGICRIEVGRGMEHYVSNGAARSIVEETMKPEFARRRFTRGLRAGLLRLMKLGRGFRIDDASLPPHP